MSPSSLPTRSPPPYHSKSACDEYKMGGSARQSMNRKRPFQRLCIIERCRKVMLRWCISYYWEHRNGEWGCCDHVTLEVAAAGLGT